ncbi:glycosyl hydrolase-related protein [Bifidobacterium longum]|uniref:alpha-mannosidase n=1 Tax=Bifidobacterium longum TaxID=216816 RepID=UPI001F32AC83|nr:alpha-mannosidase [Bifidobacterium longum]UIP48988.1 glycosyl hydrolase-related protein [Bifidobacterium longum]
MFLLPNQQLERCDRVMQQRVKPHIHTTLAACTLRSFHNPGEPVPSSEFLAKVRNGQVPFEPFRVPGVWGTAWGTTWFEVNGHIDMAAVKGRKVELMVDLGWLDHRGPGFQSEGLVYRADGTAIKSANPRNHWIPLVYADGGSTVELDEHGDFTVYIEAAANPFVEGPTPFSPTELGEEATGTCDFPYTLSRMDVTIFNEDVFAYYMDLETVSSLIRELKDDDPRYWQLAKALQRSLNIYDERDLETVSAARAALAGVLAEPAASSAIKHIAIGHAHIDSAWLWPVRETRRKVARTVSNVLALMDEDPDFTYAMSSAQQYAWLEEEHPDLFARMKRRIEEGRFIPVGGMWVESDNMIPSGESLVRQITFGRRYFKEHLGVAPRGIWLPDSFGYTGSWPQIARRAGFDWFLTQKISWNDTTKFPHHSFMWEGIDGTRILTHFPPSDTYCSWMSMRELMYSQRNFLDKDLSRNAILLYGFGDGGGGPTREMTARIRRDHDLAGAPKIEFGTPDQLFDRVRKDIVDDAQGETPVFKGELYLELHRATLTAQQDMKRGCRQEESMLRVTEYLCAAARIKNPDYVYPREELDRIWKTLLLNQFHDILPGSAIAWVHRQARTEYARDIARLNEIALEAGRAIAVVEPDDATITDAVIAPYSRQVCETWVVRPASSRAEAGTASMARVAVTHDGDTIVLDNGRLHVRIEADGTVSSIVDQRTNRELVPAGTRLGRYEMLKDEPFHWDAWDIQRDAFLTANALSEASIASVDETANGGAVVHAVTRAKGVEIRTGIALRPGSATLDFTADVDWHAVEQFLKVDMPVTVQAVNAQYECQYGLVERPINKNTRSDDAKFESCTHRFVRIADADYAAAVVNASTYGSDVSPIHADAAHGTGRGTMVRLSLLSAPLYPDPRTDQGAHSFAWSLVADADMNAVLDEAARLNSPVIGELPDMAPLVSLADATGTIVLDWIKLADDGSSDLIVRLYEAAGGNATATLRLDAALSDAKARVQEVNLMEEPELDTELPRALAGDEPMPADGAVVSLAPFQLATLRIRR